MKTPSITAKCDVDAILDSIRGVQIQVCGDTLVDLYLHLANPRASKRNAQHVSCDLIRKATIPGGAANVACYAAALGARVEFHSIFFAAAHEPVDYLESIENLSLRLIYTKDWRNPVKTRSVIGSDVRMQGSYEPDGLVPALLSEQLVDQVLGMDVKTIALADYGRGAVNYRQARRLCESGNQVLVDPHKRTEWSRYDGAHCVKGSHLFFAEDYGQSACSPIRIITHAEQGSQLWRTGHASPVWIPAISTRVADTTGAGDCYLAALACCTAAGVPTFEACQFASVVASMSVERIGTEPIYPHEIRDWASTVACS